MKLILLLKIIIQEIDLKFHFIQTDHGLSDQEKVEYLKELNIKLKEELNEYEVNILIAHGYVTMKRTMASFRLKSFCRISKTDVEKIAGQEECLKNRFS